VAKVLRLLLLGLIGAAIVHIAVLLLVPLYSSKNAWSHLEALGDTYRFHLLSEKSGLISDQDPLMEQAACRFDLSEGPVHITTKGATPFWSLSVYAPNGDNLYSLNDNVSADKKLDLIICGVSFPMQAGVNKCKTSSRKRAVRRMKRATAVPVKKESLEPL